jgi:hypothetical protein
MLMMTATVKAMDSLHRLTTGDAADGSSAEKAIQNIETDVPGRSRSVIFFPLA